MSSSPEAPRPQGLDAEPGDSLQVGADRIKPVGEYDSPNYFRGTIRGLTVQIGR